LLKNEEKEGFYLRADTGNGASPRIPKLDTAYTFKVRLCSDRSLEREKIIYSARAEIKGAWWRNVPPPDFIKRDLEDISKCDMLVAYLPRISAGTCMELFYAKMKGKRTVTICELENPSPWIIFHSDVILGSIEDLEEFLKDRKYGKKES